MSTLFHFEQPAWLRRFVDAQPRRHDSDAARIDLAIALSALSIEHGSGPFGAAIFSADGELVSATCNLVVSGGSSLWHAETLAILLAQQKLGDFDLGGRDLVLASSCEPCLMCMGALMWSGIDRLLCGAGDADARAIGFDEGPKPERWIDAFAKRGIRVETGLNREAAQAVMRRYADGGGAIYNPRRNG